MRKKSEKVKYTFFSDCLKSALINAGVTPYRLCEDTPLHAPNVSLLLRGTQRPTDDTLKSLSEYEPLGLNYTELRAWRLYDEYTSEEMRVCLRLKEDNRREYMEAVETQVSE